MDRKEHSNRHQVTPAEAAAMLGVAPVTVRSWAQKGWLRANVTAGGHRRFSMQELERFAQQRGMTLQRRGDQRVRILVVEDDALFADFLVELLTRAADGAEVRVARDGFEAGAQVMDFLPDIVLLDLMMPGVDGFSVCRQVKMNPRTRAIRVIAMTGHASPDNVKRIVALGAERCLAKPIDSADLLTAIAGPPERE